MKPRCEDAKKKEGDVNETRNGPDSHDDQRQSEEARRESSCEIKQLEEKLG